MCSIGHFFHSTVTSFVGGINCNMHSFLFPEDLDPLPMRLIEHEAPRPRKISDPVPRRTGRPRPAAIILPPTFKYDAIDFSPKDELVVSVTRLSLDERSPRLQKMKEKRPSTLSRWKSATLAKQEKDDRNIRMALAEAERAAHAGARIDNGLSSPRRKYIQLPSLSEEGRSPHSPMDYGVHHVAF